MSSSEIDGSPPWGADSAAGASTAVGGTPASAAYREPGRPAASARVSTVRQIMGPIIWARRNYAFVKSVIRPSNSPADATPAHTLAPPRSRGGERGGEAQVAVTQRRSERRSANTLPRP